MMQEMSKETAYAIVLKDILEGCGLFIGKYDAKYGDKKFMYGIATVTEWIAHSVDEEIGYAFESIFLKNMGKK